MSSSETTAAHKNETQTPKDSKVIIFKFFLNIYYNVFFKTWNQTSQNANGGIWKSMVPSTDKG